MEAAAGREEAGRTTTMQIHIDKERPGGTAREEPGGGFERKKEQHTTRGGGGEAYLPIQFPGHGQGSSGLARAGRAVEQHVRKLQGGWERDCAGGNGIVRVSVSVVRA